MLAVEKSGDLALVGGSDGVAGIYSLTDHKLLQSLNGGGGAITSGLWAGQRAVIATSIGRVKVFEAQKEVGSFSIHAGSVTAVALHPSGDILVSVGEDQSYILYDLQTLKVLSQVQSDSGKFLAPLMDGYGVLTCISAHLRPIPSRWASARRGRKRRSNQNFRRHVGSASGDV